MMAHDGIVCQAAALGVKSCAEVLRAFAEEIYEWQRS
jgi:hypothetical protein